MNMKKLLSILLIIIPILSFGQNVSKNTNLERVYTLSDGKTYNNTEYERLVAKRKVLTDAKWTLYGASALTIGVTYVAITYKGNGDTKATSGGYALAGIFLVSGFVCDIIEDFTQVKINEKSKAIFTGNGLKINF